MHCRIHPLEGPLLLRRNRLVATTIAMLATITVTVLVCDLLCLALVVFQFAFPKPDPIAHILGRTIDTSLRQPKGKNDKATPESDAERQSHPEEHALNQHIDEFERDVEDDEHQSDLGEVGLFEQRLEGGDEVFVEDVVERRQRTEDARGEVSIAEEVACPV